MEIIIGKRRIGPGHTTFIVAEMSGNHHHSFKRALQIIDAAAQSGADAIKLQTYTPDTLTIKSDKKWFRIGGRGSWSGQTLYDLYQKAYTPWEWHLKLKQYAAKRGLVFFSSPFDNPAVDFLEKLGTPLYKIAGYEMLDIPLLERVARTKKPVILSAAMASKKEIALAVKTLRQHGTRQLAVLHCVNAYPASPPDMNTRTIPDIMKSFKVVSGLSDHSLNNVAAIGSVALGGSIIEKHLTLARRDGGVDAKFSLEPKEFKSLVQTVRDLEQSLGRVYYGVGASEKPNLIFRRSLFVVADVKKGERLTKNNVRSIRPGYGLPPKFLSDIIGKRARCNIAKDTPLSWKLIWK